MARKPFEDLTISDDFMFCKVMEHKSICKEFLEMLFNAQIEKINNPDADHCRKRQVLNPPHE